MTFNSSGIYYTQGANSTISDLTVLADNKIVIGGNFTSYNGVTANRLARLNPNGSIDNTFVVGTGPNTSPTVIKQYPGGKILLGGSFASYNGTASARLARLNQDGSYDTSFVVGTITTGTVSTFTVLSDGKVMVGGNLANYNGTAKNGIARLNADGTDDATFSVTGTAATIRSVVPQTDGKFIVGGVFAQIGGQTRQSIARLNANGTFDATFDAGTGLNSTGTPLGSINDMALLTDGSVIFVGVFNSYNGTTRSSIARAATNGTLDASLNPTTVQAGNINAIAKQTDGKVLIGGSFDTVNGSVRGNIARLNADGSLDATFTTGSGANSYVSSISVQANGKIVIGGNFSSYNGNAINRIARLNADGSFDMSFNPGTGITSGEVITSAIQADGKIIIGGAFPSVTTVTVNNIARLNTDGSLDSSFATGTGVNSTVRKVLVQPDGKIIVGGEFATFNGGPKTRLMRINPDGTNDASFVTGTINSAVRDVALQADGRLVIVGSFTSVNAITRNRAARLNADGSLDTSFDPGIGFTQDVYAVAVLTDGKYMVGGIFTTAGGLSRTRIARLRNNGTLDPKFLQGLGPVGSSAPQVRTIVPHNGRYLIGGQFETYNTSPRSGVLLMSNATKAPVDYDGDGRSDWAIARQYGGLGDWTYWINTSGASDITTFNYGIFTVDGLQPGDFDGDGKTDVAVFRGAGPANEIGYWITLSSTNITKLVPFGRGGDRPTLEDYDGDGKDDMSVWREPGVGTIGQSTWFYQASSNNPTNSVTYVPFGMRYGTTQQDQVDDLYPGDFDGDGKADFRVQRRADTSVTTLSTPAVWFTLTTSNGQISTDYWGWAGDRGIPGDYDGDGKTDLAIARGFNITPNTTTWYIRYTGGRADATIQWGAGGLDQFAQGDYDGDGITDMTVYRRGMENNYYVRRSSDLKMMVYHWGDGNGPGGPGGDIAIAAYNNR